MRTQRKAGGTHGALVRWLEEPFARAYMENSKPNKKINLKYFLDVIDRKIASGRRYCMT